VKHLAALLLCLSVCFSGCLSPEGKVGDPPSTAAAAVSFYAALATYVESDQCESSDEFLKASARAARLRGVVLGDQWDTAFAEIGKANVELTTELRSEIAAKCRGMK
jgi:hypothetical protein